MSIESRNNPAIRIVFNNCNEDRSYGDPIINSVVDKLQNFTFSTYAPPKRTLPLDPAFTMYVKSKAISVGANEQELSTESVAKTIQQLWDRFLEQVLEFNSIEEINIIAIQKKLNKFLDKDIEVEKFIKPFRAPQEEWPEELHDRFEAYVERTCEHISKIHQDYQNLMNRNKPLYEMYLSQLKDRIRVANGHITAENLELLLDLMDGLPKEVVDMIERFFFGKHEYDSVKKELKNAEIQVIMNSIKNPNFKIPKYTINHSEVVEKIAGEIQELLEEINEFYPNSFNLAQEYLIKSYECAMK